MNPKRKSAEAADPNRFGRRRAAVLLAIHVLAAAHITHWKMTGHTVAPFELNEAVYTLELGIVTTGAIVMGSALVLSALFGRFFCGWACHMVALQDLCAWLMRKLKIPLRPLRSRWMLLVPLAAMLYMFAWPQFVRLAEGRDWPGFHASTDAEGWGSFKTKFFFRNLPGPLMMAFTFGVIGVMGIWTLGTRSFCNYACPYGALFGVFEKLAPLRIRTRGGCQSCGACTAVCDSRIRVHEEIARYGMIVDSRCLKDLDCVAACKNSALTVGLGRPALFKKRLADVPVRRLTDLTIFEEVGVGAFTLLGILISREAYGLIPFFLSIVFGLLLAAVGIFTLRLIFRPDVAFRGFTLSRGRRLTPAGYVFAAAACGVFCLAADTAIVRGHEYLGDRIQKQAALRGGVNPVSDEAALAHFEASNAAAFMRQPLVDTSIAEILCRRAAAAGAAGRIVPAIADLKRAVALRPDHGPAHKELGVLLAERGDLPAALLEAKLAVAFAPEDGDAWHNFAVIAAQSGKIDLAKTASAHAAALLPADEKVNAFRHFLDSAAKR